MLFRCKEKSFFAVWVEAAQPPPVVTVESQLSSEHADVALK